MEEKKLPLAVIFIIIAFLMLAGCDTDSGDNEPEIIIDEVINITISGLQSVAKGLYARYNADVEVTGAATKTVSWSIKETDKNSNTTLKTISGSGVLSVAGNEALNSLTIVAKSSYSPDVIAEFEVTLVAASENPDTGIMTPVNSYTYQIQSFWYAPVGSGRNYLVDDNGKLALGQYGQNLPYSSWYLMKTADGKKAFKNVGTGNYINRKEIVRFVGGGTLEQLNASQPNVSPFEDDPAFFWDYKDIGYNWTGIALPALEINNIVGTSILNHGFTTAEGGAISHETVNRVAIPSQNNPALFHVQWRYDAGDVNDEEDNALWDIRIGNLLPEKPFWGGYIFGMYVNTW